MADVSIWTYPWDLHDIGIAETEARLRDAGANMISLAASYHAGRFVQPGNPKRRVYFPQDGTVYYRPDPNRWQGAEIRPLMADIVSTEGDMFAEMIRRRDKGGLKVSAWTVCLHNSRLGMLHPDHSLRTAFGDPSCYGLCPSSPAARAYVVTMVREIAETYAPDRIEIESPGFMVFSHGYHHEKDGLPLTPEDEFLLGLCFCPHCMAAADSYHIPSEEARRTAVDLLNASFARDLPEPRFPDFPTRGTDVFGEYRALSAYIGCRFFAVADFLAEIRSNVRPHVKLLLIDFEGAEAEGVDPHTFIHSIDGILHCAYRTRLQDIAPLMADRRALLGPGRTLVAGFQLFHPNQRDRADLAAKVAETRPHADGLNFYCLGLVPPARLDWIRTAL